MNENSEERLVWIDLEMSGLNAETDVILEIATIITDSNLNVIDHTPSMVIHQPDEMLDAMDEWNTTHHGASGLTDAVRSSLISLAEAEAVTLDLVSKHTVKDQSPLCGNSIWKDRVFLSKYMPVLEDYLHYRIIDVSSLKELVRVWHPRLLDQVKQKSKRHRALDDILESIEELKFYREKLFGIN